MDLVAAEPEALWVEPVFEPGDDVTQSADATADQFTSGVVVPFVAPEPKETQSQSAYAPPETAPKMEMAAANVAIQLYGDASGTGTIGTSTNPLVLSTSGAVVNLEV